LQGIKFNQTIFMNAEFIIQELLSVANPEKAQFLQRFFKTGKGEYAEGDVMLGIVVPLTRDIVKRSPKLSLNEIQILVDSDYHEVRLAGFLFLVKQFKKATESEQKEIFDFYLKNARKANNWDLVDVTCRDVIGLYLLDNEESRGALYKLAGSDNLWEQRIAIVSTWTFIKHKQFADTLAIAEKLLKHKHDLMHKAVGWMLREVGKKDKAVLVEFLEKHHKKMPRTALRYAIEHFSAEERAHFMEK
jgi:3-methyladenine DNA glycosylase AlkD